MPLRMPRRAGLLLKTGQLTSYSGKLDDGHYECGLKKRYAVLSTGQYAGTSNIDLIHFTDTDVSFTAATKTIASVGTDLSTLFVTGDTIVITGSANNNGVYASVTVSGTDIVTSEALTDEAAGATVSIAKREALSNNCVLDLNTGLMWARYTSAQNAAMGPASDGKMPWTGQLYDIFQWAAAANAASLGGYSDWRISNRFQLESLLNLEAASSVPDSTAFPGWPISDNMWTSTTAPVSITTSFYVAFNPGVARSNQLKTQSYFTCLVRGGI